MAYGFFRQFFLTLLSIFLKTPRFTEEFSERTLVNVVFLYEILEILHFFSLQFGEMLAIVKSLM
jgi:hypothetical protein